MRKPLRMKFIFLRRILRFPAREIIFSAQGILISCAGKKIRCAENFVSLRRESGLAIQGFKIQ
jgi:hypothetical protein